MVKSVRVALYLSALFLASVPIFRASAGVDPAYAYAVSACGTLPSGVTYNLGHSWPMTMTNAGILCTSAGGGGGGGTSSSFAATFPTTGTAAGAEYLAAPPTLTTGQMVALQTDVNGNLKVNIASGGGSGGTASSFAAAFPGTGTAAGAEYLAAAPTLTTGQMVPFQTDINGNLKIVGLGDYAQGSTTSGQIGPLAQAAVTGGTATYTAATTQPLTMTTQGLLRIIPYGVNGTMSMVPTAPGTAPANGLAVGGIYNSGGQTLTTGQSDGIQLDVNGNIKVDLATALPAGSALVGKVGIDQTTVGTTNAISLAQIGSVTASTGAGAIGTGTLRTGIAQDTTTIAGSAPGTAGTASLNVITVQGIASMTPLLSNPGTAANWGIVTQGSTTSGQSGQMAMGAVTTAAPTYTTAQTSPLSLDTAGNLRVNVVTGGGAGGTSSTFNATFPSTGTAAGGEYLTSAPTLTTGQMVALQTDINGNLKTNVVNTNANGRTTAANSSPVVSVAAASTAGAIAANNTTAVVVKGSAGTLFGVQVYGIGSAPAYLKIYNAATATCGSGTPVKRLMIPAASTAANGAGSNVTFGPGLAMGTGITYCVTTGITDTDTTAPAASTFLVNVDYE